MILECPACHARFAVPDAQIPEGGRKVRCSRCTHEWHTASAPAVVAPVKPVPPRAVTPEPLFETPAPVEIAPPVMDSAPQQPMEDDFLSRIEAAMAEQKAPNKPFVKPIRPVAKKRTQDMAAFKLAAPCLAAVWLVAAFITYAPSWSRTSVLSGIYHAVGASQTDGLAFSDVTMERAQEGSKTKFILSGSVRNQSNESRTVPTVRVSLRDKADKAVWGREYPVNAELKAGEIYPFRITNVETSFASSVNSIVMDMGNSLQLLVR